MRLRTLVLVLLGCAGCFAQALPIHWEDLTAEDFVKALRQSGNTCATGPSFQQG